MAADEFCATRSFRLAADAVVDGTPGFAGLHMCRPYGAFNEARKLAK